MTHGAHASRFTALMLTLLIASDGRADWLNSFAYSAAVSNAVGGPFAATANLWTESVPAGTTPSSVNLFAEAQPQVRVMDGMAYLPFALLDVTLGNSGNGLPTLPPLPFYIQLTMPGMPNVVLSGNVAGPNPSDPFLITSGPPVQLTVAGKPFEIAVQALPMPLPGGHEADATSFTAIEFELVATIPVNELAAAPEPSSLLLAGLGAAALAGATWRRGRRRRRSAA